MNIIVNIKIEQIYDGLNHTYICKIAQSIDVDLCCHSTTYVST